ncbi:MAG: Gfo/Idh/MocA family protein [Thermoguttaceae bacterium]
MDKVRLGVIGTGRLGSFHASKAAANPDVEFVGVADVCEAARKRVATQHGVRDYGVVSDLLAEVDAVVVATPSILHAEIGRGVLGAGKHLLMEKPVTTDGSSALELTRLAKEKGVVFQVGHVEQHNPAWRAAWDRLEDVRMGLTPVMIDATRTSGYTFRSTDVGATLDLMIHDLELVLSLVPSPVERVSAFGVAQMGGHEDSSYATLLFANGSVARLKASRVEQRAERRMTIQAANKTVQIDFATRSARMICPKQKILAGAYSPSSVTLAEMSERVPTFMTDEYETIELVHDPIDALELEMQNFTSSILRGERSVVPGERAAEAVVVAEEIIHDLEARACRAGTSQTRTLKIAG